MFLIAYPGKSSDFFIRVSWEEQLCFYLRVLGREMSVIVRVMGVIVAKQLEARKIRKDFCQKCALLGLMCPSASYVPVCDASVHASPYI